jgi:hypothetical protein
MMNFKQTFAQLTERCGETSAPAPRLRQRSATSGAANVARQIFMMTRYLLTESPLARSFRHGPH